MADQFDYDANNAMLSSISSQRHTPFDEPYAEISSAASGSHSVGLNLDCTNIVPEFPFQSLSKENFDNHANFDTTNESFVPLLAPNDGKMVFESHDWNNQSIFDTRGQIHAPCVIMGSATHGPNDLYRQQAVATTPAMHTHSEDWGVPLDQGRSFHELPHLMRTNRTPP